MMKSVKLHAEVIEAAQAWERRSIVAFTVAQGAAPVQYGLSPSMLPGGS